MRHTTLYVGVFIIAAIIVGITAVLLNDDDDRQDPPKATGSKEDLLQPNETRFDNDILSRLPKGKLYLGWHVGFNQENPPETEVAIETAMKAAFETTEVDIRHFDWRELEPQEGEYDLQDFQEYLLEMGVLGKRPLLFIPAIDSAGFVTPSDLGKPDEKVLFANRSMDDPIILSRYQALLSTILPLAIEMTNNSVWGIIVGNEPDGFIEDFPERCDEIVNFLASVRYHIESMDLEPALGVAMVTTSAVEDPRKDSTIQRKIQSVTQTGSFAAYNVYCDHTLPNGASYQQTKERLERLIDIAGDKPIVIQELGCSSGSPEFEASWFMSEDMQVEWIDTMERLLSEYSQFRAAFWFTLVDGSPDFYGYFDDLLVSEIRSICFEEDTLCIETMTNFTRNAKATIATYGLIEYETGNAKPALNRYLSWINSTVSK